MIIGPSHTSVASKVKPHLEISESLIVWNVEAPAALFVLFCFIYLKNHTENLGKQIHNQFSNYVFQTCGGNKLFLPPLTEFCEGKCPFPQFATYNLQCTSMYSLSYVK